MTAMSRVCVLALLFALLSMGPASSAASAVRLPPFADAAPEPPHPTSPLTLIVGGVSEMKTRNLLPPIANDVPTSDVLFRVYDTVLLTDPVTAGLLPYIVKGTDFNEDGMFDPSTEYGVFEERPGATTPLEITLYYDFNGVYWHDGVQMTAWDFLFSYHLNAMNGRFSNDLRTLFCDSTISYESCGRQLGVRLWDTDGNPANGYQKVWLGEGSLPGDPNLRVGVRHILNAPYAEFFSSTIAPVMLPIHEWSRTFSGRHADFGCAVWIPPAEASAKGIPECSNPDPSRWGTGIAAAEPVPGSRPYTYPTAESWALADQDVIGHGPFRFETWVPGVEARVIRNEQFFYGVDPNNPAIVYDAQLPRKLKKPTIDGITFQPFADATLCAEAVNSSAVDFCHANIPPNLVPNLRNTTGVVVAVNPEFTFHYASYNLRRAPFGYRNNDPADDVGYWFRQVVSHLVDRDYYVQTLRGGLAKEAYGVVSPENTFWYNDSIPKPGYNLSLANAILDGQGWIDTDGDGFRELEGIGDAAFTVYASNFDSARLNASVALVDDMVAVGLNATLVPMTTAQLANNLSAHTFDMYVLGWRFGSSPPDPDYLWNFFHSANADFGQNYPGFNNTTFDAVINASRTEMNRSLRSQEIFEAQGIVAEERAYEVFYYLTNVEAYREDRWVNWTVSAGTIWNYWSLLGIYPPSGSGFQITIGTTPPSLQVSVNGAMYTAPRTFPCTPGSTREIGTPTPQVAGTTRYVFASWSDGGAQTHTITCDSTKTITAAFATQHEITVDTSPAALEVLIGGSPATAPYVFWCDAGSVFAIGVRSPQVVGATRFLFDSWSNGGSQNHTVACSGGMSLVAAFTTDYETTIDTTPTGLGVQVSATDVTAPYTFWCPEGQSLAVDAYSVQDRAGTRYTFTGWSDGGPQSRFIACSAPATYVSLYDVSAYEVTLDTDPPGREVVVDGLTYTAPYTFWCAAGTSPILHAPSPQVVGATRYLYGSWSDGGSQTHPILCDAPGTYVASFPTLEYAVTVDTVPAGLQVEVDGLGQAAPYSFWCPAASSHLLNAPSPQVLGATRHLFVSWSDSGAQTHAITCGAPATFTASFSTEYRIVVDTDPAGLQVDVDGTLYMAPNTLWCPAGGSVTLSAPSPQDGGTTRRLFVAWSDGGSQTHSITCTAPATLMAYFGTEFLITVETLPAGLAYEVDGSAVPSPFWCAEGTSFSLASPSPQGSGSTRYAFAAWSDGGSQTHAVPCAAPATLTAEFAVEYEVVVDTTPLGLEILVGGNRVAGPQTTWCREGASLSLEAPSPQTLGSATYRFEGWSDDGAQSHSIVCSGPGSYTATFEAVPPGTSQNPILWIAGGVAVVAIVLAAIALWVRRRRTRNASRRGGEPPPR